LVAAFDYLIFANIDKLAKRLNPTSLVASEVVFGILLTAVAVQLAVHGLGLLGIITPLQLLTSRKIVGARQRDRSDSAAI
jgi:multiple antibiotic resistance protein